MADSPQQESFSAFAKAFVALAFCGACLFAFDTVADAPGGIWAILAVLAGYVVFIRKDKKK